MVFEPTMKCAFDWDVYKSRKTALQYLKKNNTLVDTILETENGDAYELVHSQIISAFGDKMNDFIRSNGTFVESYKSMSFKHIDRAFLSPLDEADEIRSISHGSNIIAPAAATATATSDNSGNSNNNNSLTSTSSPSPTPGSVAVQDDHQRTTNGNKKARIEAANHYQYWITNWPGKAKLIRLAKVDSYTLGILVDCAYTGYIRTDLATGGIWKVLRVADHYEMHEVIRACCSFLAKNLNRTNCVRLYHIGARHKHPLQRAAWNMIRSNFKFILADNLAASLERSCDVVMLPDVVHRQETGSSASPDTSSPSWQDARESSPDRNATGTSSLSIPSPASRPEPSDDKLTSIKYEHFEPLLMHDKLNIVDEESVWHAIKLWCCHDLPERSSKVSQLLCTMRFPRFRSGLEFSARHIWRDPLVINNDEAQQQLAVLDRYCRDFSNSSKYLRDGYNLPCASNPRQLRPRIPNSVLMAIGGWQQGQPTTLIESYDLNTNLWFESKHRMMAPLAYHGIELINGLLYICGGTDGSEILNEVFTYDPVDGQCAQKPSMREARCYVSTAHIDGYMYCMGGHNGLQRMRSVERFDVSNEVWTHVTDMNVARSDASACVYQSRVYVAGGLNDQVIECSVEFYNPTDNTWTFITSMSTPRTSFTLLLHQNHLLAIGGNNGSERLSSVEQYDFVRKQWSHHSNMRHRRSTFSAAIMEENKLIVVGGYNGQTPFNQVEMYDEQSHSWAQLHKIRFDRSGLKAVVISDLPNALDYTFLGSLSRDK